MLLHTHRWVQLSRKTGCLSILSKSIVVKHTIVLPLVAVFSSCSLPICFNGLLIFPPLWTTLDGGERYGPSSLQIEEFRLCATAVDLTEENRLDPERSCTAARPGREEHSQLGRG